MVFPLPLVPFEQYMLADDRAGYPMNFFVRLRFSGLLRRAALESALQTVLPRHPLLQATVQRASRRRLQWAPLSDGRPTVHWLPRPPANRYPHAEPIDLWAEPGLRMSVLLGEDSSDLVAQFHHACCDGQGAMLFLEDLLLAYAAHWDRAGIARLRPLDAESLPDRARHGLAARELLAILHRQLVGLVGVWQFFAHAPVPAVPDDPPQRQEKVPEGYPAACSRQLSEAELAALRAAAKRAGVTVNELLLRDLLLALDAWRARHCPRNDRQWLRISVPMNLRTLAEEQLPAANVVSMVFIDRRPQRFADPDGLLAGIHRQMTRIKQLGLGLTFLWSLWAVRALGALPRMAAAEKCSATCVLTNLGTQWSSTPLPRRQGRIVLGDAVLESIEILPPFRPFTCVAFSALTYAGRLRLTLHYDPRPLNAAQAEDLMETFAGQVCGSLRAAA